MSLKDEAVLKEANRLINIFGCELAVYCTIEIINMVRYEHNTYYDCHKFYTEVADKIIELGILTE
jgi:hypothetical protein